MQFWNDLVCASGAKLKLTKCFMQIIHFKFGTNGAPVVHHLKDNLHLELIDWTKPPSQNQSHLIIYFILKFGDNAVHQ